MASLYQKKSIDVIIVMNFSPCYDIKTIPEICNNRAC